MRYKVRVRSLQRGLEILETISRASRPLSLTEIATQNGLSKTAALRFLETLCALGYLNRGEDKRYSLATKMLSLGFSFLNSSSLRAVAKVYVDELSNQLDKTVNLAVLDGLEILFLYRKEVRRFLKFDLQAGSRLPSYCTASGKVLLAGLEDGELKERISRMTLHQITPKTIISKEELWNEIMETRKRGYSICDQELSMDLYSIAFPLLNAEGKIIAAINVSLDAKDKHLMNMDEIIAKLKDTSENVSRTLGYKGLFPRFPGKGDTNKKGGLQ